MLLSKSNVGLWSKVELDADIEIFVNLIYGVDVKSGLTAGLTWLKVSVLKTVPSLIFFKDSFGYLLKSFKFIFTDL